MPTKPRPSEVLWHLPGWRLPWQPVAEPDHSFWEGFLPNIQPEIRSKCEEHYIIYGFPGYLRQGLEVGKLCIGGNVFTWNAFEGSGLALEKTSVGRRRWGGRQLSSLQPPAQRSEVPWPSLRPAPPEAAWNVPGGCLQGAPTTDS